MVFEKTGCCSGFRVNQYKPLCAFSVSLISLNSVLIFANWYKQPIVSAKQPIVRLTNNRFRKRDHFRSLLPRMWCV